MKQGWSLLRIGPLLLAISIGVTAASQNSQNSPQPGSSTRAGSPAVTVSLQTQDNSPFTGSASVRMLPSEGNEIIGAPSGSNGETIFADLSPGAYTVEARAPGFLAIRKQIQIESDGRFQTVFLVMKPSPVSANAPQPALSVVAPAAAARASRPSWIPSTIDDVPAVKAGVECPVAHKRYVILLLGLPNTRYRNG
jgi:hypothetical protein